MVATPITRRTAVSCLALAASFALLPGRGFAAASPAPDHRIATTAALIRTAFPHRRLDARFYVDVASNYIKELGANPAALKALDEGLAQLDASHIGPFARLPAVIQAGLVSRIDQQPFFRALLWRGAELIYRDRTVWKMVGFEGSSVEHGGYIERGFNDIDWLPQPKSSKPKANKP